jgi:hypothetical protein
MGYDTDEIYHLFRQAHKELHKDLWHLIERRESRLCWRWLGSHDADGFAEYAFDHDGTIYTLNVHRYLFHAIYDDLPAEVVHTCKNKWCCNINHLAAATTPAVVC